MQRDDGLWARDWALLGGISSFGAPFAASWVVGADLLVTWACIAGLTGLVTGAFVGLAVRAVLGRVPERAWVGFSLGVAPFALAIWGFGVAGVATAMTEPGLFLFAMPAGSVSAVVQLAWFAPIYAWLAREDRPRLPLVTASGLMAPLAGAVAVGGVVGVVLLANPHI